MAAGRRKGPRRLPRDGEAGRLPSDRRGGLRRAPPGVAESPERDVSDEALLVVLLVPMVLALGFGIWAGLGYPGLYGTYEGTGKAPRKTPFEMFMDWLVRKFDL